jgi:undecaprenyl-diphosphatase
MLYNFASGNRTLEVIATFLIAGSALMWLAEWAYKKASDYPKTRIMGRGEVILIGVFQTLALFPGMSRSGSTISGALFLGRNRAESVRFSFLLSVPIILLVGIFDFLKMILDWFQKGTFSLLPSQDGWTTTTILFSLSSLVVGLIISYLSGLIVLKWLINYLSKNTFKWFIVYRVVAAVAIFAFVWWNNL